MRRLRHHGTRQADGIPGARHAGNCSCLAGAAVHDGCIELIATLSREYRTFAGIEQWVIFQYPHRRLDRVQAGATAAQQARAGLQGGKETRAVGRFSCGREGAGLENAGATVNSELPGCGGANRRAQWSDTKDCNHRRDSNHSCIPLARYRCWRRWRRKTGRNGISLNRAERSRAAWRGGISSYPGEGNGNGPPPTLAQRCRLPLVDPGTWNSALKIGAQYGFIDAEVTPGL